MNLLGSVGIPMLFESCLAMMANADVWNRFRIVFTGIDSKLSATRAFKLVSGKGCREEEPDKSDAADKKRQPRHEILKQGDEAQKKQNDPTSRFLGRTNSQLPSLLELSNELRFIHCIGLTISRGPKCPF